MTTPKFSTSTHASTNTPARPSTKRSASSPCSVGPLVHRRTRHPAAPDHQPDPRDRHTTGHRNCRRPRAATPRLRSPSCSTSNDTTNPTPPPRRGRTPAHPTPSSPKTTRPSSMNLAPHKQTRVQLKTWVIPECASSESLLLAFRVGIDWQGRLAKDWGTSWDYSTMPTSSSSGRYWSTWRDAGDEGGASRPLSRPGRDGRRWRR